MMTTEESINLDIPEEEISDKERKEYRLEDVLDELDISKTKE